MATKKKNTRSDPESKDDSFLEAQREDRRATELWDRSSATMKDVFTVAEDLQSSLEAALTAVEEFVSESKRVSGELRGEQCEAKADAFSKRADEWAPIASKEFRKAATELVDIVHHALTTGYPVHVLKLAERLKVQRLGKWGRLCAESRVLLRTQSPEQRDAGRPFAKDLINRLREIDSRAKALTPERVIEEANEGKPTDAGFAAELALLCGAFEYKRMEKRDDYRTAQRAIAKAMQWVPDAN
jgi:hypothetical protein